MNCGFFNPRLAHVARFHIALATAGRNLH